MLPLKESKTIKAKAALLSFGFFSYISNGQLPRAKIGEQISNFVGKILSHVNSFAKQ